MSINLYLGESHAGQKNIAQLFYSDDSHDWKKNTAITVPFEDNVIPYSVGEIDFSNNLVRIDPFNACKGRLFNCKGGIGIWSIHGSFHDGKGTQGVYQKTT